MLYGTILDAKMTSVNNSPKKWCDRQFKVYTQIYFIGPLDLFNMSITKLNYIAGK